MNNDLAEAIARLEAAQSGPLDIVKLCRWLSGHRWTLSIDERDAAMNPIVGFVSETDVFDVEDEQRAQWSPERLTEKDAELEDYVKRCDGMRVQLAALLARLRAAIGVWVFFGERAQFACAVFGSLDTAEACISENGFTGLLTWYPLDETSYDWAIRTGAFRPKSDDQRKPAFRQSFTSGTRHHHYEDGVRTG
jgi:hypothetical protein